MPLHTLMVLAVIQGITEFLPISSSAHLILFPVLTGTEDQGLTIDVAVHVGTLLAVILYFWRDVSRLFVGVTHMIRGRRETAEYRLLWLLVLATIPVVIGGALLKLFGLTEMLRSAEVIAWATIIFGALLWIADRFSPRERTAESWTARDAAVMGLCQALALIPGTSRSGITMTGARFLGFERVDSARLSMLMAIPTISAAGVLLGLEVAQAGNVQLGLDALIAALLAFAAALVALFFMMRMLRTWSMTPFVIYRLILGAGLLLMVYGSGG